MTLLIRRAEVGDHVVDVLVDGDRIVEVGAAVTRPPGTSVVDAGGGALVPGLHDHHLHLLALAARPTSLDVGPPGVRSPADLDHLLEQAHQQLPPGRWIRGTGHDEETGGFLDRHRLDRLAPGRPVRVQHRSGALWTLSSAALEHLPLDPPPDGVSTDEHGLPDGRIWRLDDWLRRRLRTEPPDLAAVGRTLAGHGITGVTDATPFTDRGSYDLLADAVAAGDLPLSVTVTGGPDLADVPVPPPLRRGPVKVVIGDHELPPLDVVAGAMQAAHGAGRPVAVHCVTAAAAALALASWIDVGTLPGDRMEHGSVLHPEAALRVAELGLTVVTQPAFVHDHGDRYLAEVEPGDLPHLYRCRSLLDRGVPVAGSSDAPFGTADPWVAVAAAVDRRTAAGAALGADEAVESHRALGLYLGGADDPGGRPRTVEVGAPADLCLLAEPLDAVLRRPASAVVRCTVSGGRITHELDDR